MQDTALGVAHIHLVLITELWLETSFATSNRPEWEREYEESTANVEYQRSTAEENREQAAERHIVSARKRAVYSSSHRGLIKTKLRGSWGVITLHVHGTL